MSRDNGKEISELDQLKQSVTDILSTPRGSRVMLRSYGSRLFELIDRPISKMDIFVAVHEAIDMWEPRIKLRKVSVSNEATFVGNVSEGLLEIDLIAEIRATGKPVEFTVRLGNG